MLTKLIINRIYNKKRGWCFSPKDFLDLGNQEAVWKALARFEKKGIIRKIIRGIYEYPVKSLITEGFAPVNPDAAAQAIARTNGWTILPDEHTAMVLLKISTQITARWSYITDGPNKKYTFDSITLEFKKAPLRETARLSRNSAILVHGIKGLGQNSINSEVIDKLSSFLPVKSWDKTIQECKIINGWVLETLKQAAQRAAAEEVQE